MHDQLRQLVEQGDLTSAAIRYSQYAAETEYQLSGRKSIQNTAARHLHKVLGRRNLRLRTCQGAQRNTEMTHFIGSSTRLLRFSGINGCCETCGALGSRQHNTCNFSLFA